MPKLILFIGFYYFHLVLFAECWKMKACVNGTVYKTAQDKCRAGVWFVEPRRVSSICFEGGMWAIYKDWCEQDPILWTAYPNNKGCLNIANSRTKILGIVYLGQDDRGGLVSTSGQRIFLDSRNKKPGQTVEFLDSNRIEVLTWGNGLYSLEDGNNANKMQKCLIKAQSSFFGYYEFELENRLNFSNYLQEGQCTKAYFAGSRQQVLPKRMDFKIYHSDGDDKKITCQAEVEVSRANEDLFEEDDDSLEVIQRKVDEQSHRMGLTLYKRHFSRDEPSDLGFEEWKFLQLSVDIFKKTCPKGMVSEEYLDNVFILFQFLIHESFAIFPPNVDRDDDSRLRIFTALKKCESRATNLNFRNDDACSKETPLLKYRYKNNGTTVLRLIEIPRQIKINAEKFDLILESAWKLMIFIHYFCAESFSEYPLDLSLLQNRWQSLFAPDIIRRWKNPGRSYAIMKRIFMNIDLQRTMKNIDYCVGAAHMDSVYKGWIKRPLTKWEFRERNSSHKDLIWEGHAYCAGDLIYPAEKLGYPIEKCGVRFSD